MWMTLGDSSGLDTGSTDYQGTVLGVYVGSTSSNVYTTYQGAAYINMSGSNSEMIGNSTGEGISFEATLHSPRGTQFPAVHGVCSAHDMNTNCSLYSGLDNDTTITNRSGRQDPVIICHIR